MTSSPTDFLWTVDEFVDSLRKRKASEVRKQQELAHRWGNAFESEELAIAFLFRRADERIADAEQTLKKEQQRRKNLAKRFPQLTETHAEVNSDQQ